jgi:hypothetical protein
MNTTHESFGALARAHLAALTLIVTAAAAVLILGMVLGAPTWAARVLAASGFLAFRPLSRRVRALRQHRNESRTALVADATLDLATGISGGTAGIALAGHALNTVVEALLFSQSDSEKLANLVATQMLFDQDLDTSSLPPLGMLLLVATSMLAVYCIGTAALSALVYAFGERVGASARGTASALVAALLSVALGVSLAALCLGSVFIISDPLLLDFAKAEPYSAGAFCGLSFSIVLSIMLYVGALSSIAAFRAARRAARAAPPESMPMGAMAQRA